METDGETNNKNFSVRMLFFSVTVGLDGCVFPIQAFLFLCFFNSIGGFPYPDSFWVFCFFSLLKGPGEKKKKKKSLTDFFRNKVK